MVFSKCFPSIGGVEGNGEGFDKDDTIKPMVSYVAANLTENKFRWVFMLLFLRPNNVSVLSASSGDCSPHFIYLPFELKNPRKKAELEQVQLILTDMILSRPHNLTTKSPQRFLWPVFACSSSTIAPVRHNSDIEPSIPVIVFLQSQV